MRVRRRDWDGAQPARLAAEIRAAAPSPAAVSETVAAIISELAAGGDAAALERARALGEEPESVVVGAGEAARALAGLDPLLRSALELARANLTRVAEDELAAVSAPSVTRLSQGQTVSVLARPVASAGLYAPGGRHPLASSALMAIVPARVAGVERLVVASPAGPDGLPAAVVLGVCALCGVEEVVALGGAQAIAALALGTESIDPVDVIAGPGNNYVQEAKRLLFGRVGIDSIAGPSEIVVLAGPGADPEAVALDVCAQAEHGADGPLVVLSPDAALLEALARRAPEIAAAEPSVSDATLELVATPDLGAALALSDAIAPEHLELAFDAADARVAAARVAGAVFLGAGSATAFGDYAAGSNHVLPTGGSARFAGPLGVGAFLRRSSVVEMPAGTDRSLGEAVAALAEAEGLPVHAASARHRLAGRPRGL